MTRLSVVLGLGVATALVAVLGASPAYAGPCVVAAKDDYKEAKGTCKEDFQVAKDACLNRDHNCVEACRAEREDCRAASGIDTDLAACASGLTTAIANCKIAFPPGNDRATCIDNAQVAAFVCRDTARENNKAELKACRGAFRTCAKLCGPATPPIDTAACRNGAKGDFKTCLTNSKEDFQVAKDICHNVNHTCAEQCRSDRDTCDAPVLATLAAAIAQCNATRDTGIANCNGDQTCIDQVQVVAFQCRDTAHEASHPGLNACRDTFGTCIQACPAASPSGAFLD